MRKEIQSTLFLLLLLLFFFLSVNSIYVGPQIIPNYIRKMLFSFHKMESWKKNILGRGSSRSLGICL